MRGESLADATFAPPELPAGSVNRQRLATLLDVAAHQRLTLVVAAPGYGKTVLLAQWAAAHPRQRIRWWTLGPDDDDATVFARRLRAALSIASPVADRRLPPQPDDLPGGAGTSSLLGLLAELERLPPTVLVLDDFQVLSNPAVLEDLATVIEHAPRALRFVVASRVDPPLRYYRLGFSDALIELRQDDLAFTVDEARALVGRVGCELRRPQLEKLHNRTEGWAAGLQLAALSLRDRPAVDEFVDTFAGDDRDVADYLTEQVLAGQSDHIRGFLLRTSVLDRMCAPLCDTLTGRRDGQAMLEDLDRRSMFIVKLDRQRQWYRYHQLFRTLLRQYLRDEDPGLEDELLHRAAEWHLARDEPEIGIPYLVRAAAWQEVLDAASVHAKATLGPDRIGHVAGWIGQVPPRVRQGNVATMLLEAASLGLGGEPARALAVLDDVEATAAATPADRVVAGLLRSLDALRQGALGEAIAGAQATLRELDHLDAADLPDVVGLTASRTDVAVGARAVRAIALTYQGRFADARDAFDDLPEGGHPLWQVSALATQSLLEAWSGRLGSAERRANWARSWAAQSGLDGLGCTADADLALIAVARHRNDVARARALIEEVRGAADRFRLSATLLAIEEASLTLAEGQPAIGLRVLAARGRGRHGVVPPAIVARRRATEARLRLASGDVEGATGTLALAPRETAEVAAARVRLAVERGDLRAAADALERWPDEPAPRAVLERTLWQAVLEHLDGHEATARQRISAVVLEAELEHDLALFRDHHVLGLLRAFYRDEPSPFLRAVVDQQASGGPARVVKELVEQLTEREYMVLPLLATRLSNVEIADTLGVSLNTVKTHLKHIYRKLGVTDRSEAIAVAERLRLW